MSAFTKRFIEPGMWFWIYKDAGWRSYLCTCYWSKFFFFLPSAQCWCSSVKVSHDRIMILLLVLYFQAWTVNNCCLFILRTYAAWSGFNNRATQYYGKVCLYLSFYCEFHEVRIQQKLIWNILDNLDWWNYIPFPFLYTPLIFTPLGIQFNSASSRDMHSMQTFSWNCKQNGMHNHHNLKKR